MIKKSTTEKAYDAEVEQYHAFRSAGKQLANEYVDMPATLSLLGDVKGKRILDAGCGPGLYAKKLVRRGAKVWGCDISQASLDIAEKEVPHAVFKKGSITKLPFRSNSFDIVLCALVLEHVRNWNVAFQEVRRVLKKNGVFIFSIPNPLFTRRQKVTVAGKEYRLLGYSTKRQKGLRIFGDYFDETKEDMDWGDSTVPRYPKTYETIIQTIIRNKFAILDYRDAKPTPKGANVNPRGYKIFTKLPWFCSWKVKKK